MNSTTHRPKKFFVIDTMALAYRSYFAFSRGTFSNSSGFPTGAIYGTALFLSKLIAEEKPDYICAAQDEPGPTFRHKIYPEYKAHRDRMPDDLARQIEPILELIKAIGCPIVSHKGYEADDVIGSIARTYAGENVDVYIVSGDKDFMQLLGDHVLQYVPKKDSGPQIVGPDGVREKFGCPPSKVVDCLALIGDTADNVPGAKGVGEKTAAQLIGQFGSLEELYGNLDKLKSASQREKLASSRDDVFLSRDLVTIHTDIPLKEPIDHYKCPVEDALANPAIVKIYEKYEFRSLLNKFRAAGEDKPQKVRTPAGGWKSDEAVATSLDVLDAAPVITADKIIHVNGINLAPVLVADLRKSEKLSFLVWSPEPRTITSKPEKFLFCDDSGRCFEVPGSEEGIFIIRRIFEARNGQNFLTWDLKRQIQLLGNIGVDLAVPVTDIKICHYLLHPNDYDHSLEHILRQLGLPAAEDPSPEYIVRMISHAATALIKQVEDLGLARVLRDIEMPLVPVLAEMERTGIRIDDGFLLEYSNELEVSRKATEEELYRVAGGPFNINSPKQLQELLFEKLKVHESSGMKRMKKTKTGLSTDESVLSKLTGHPVPRLILEYRAIAKLKSTYVDALPQYINPQTGRIHTTFHQTVAATGRLSSDSPNLQNIPMRTPMGRRIRAAFLPLRDGDLIISADYSQVEIRLLAHMANATGLIEAFRQGLDVHRVTASKIFGVPLEAVTGEMRSSAKAINFGIIYGMGPQRLAAETGTTMSEAKEFISRYFTIYPGIKAFTERLVEDARRNGYCTTLLGRRRQIPELRDSNRVIAARGINIAINAPIQGTAADLIKLAMLRVTKRLRSERLRTTLILQVHDELVFSTPAEEVEAVKPVIIDSMEKAIETSVPLKVDLATGHNWLESHS